MATELGQAYVQIIPSAKGISGSISKVLNGEATAAGDKSGALLGKTLISKVKGLVVGTAIGTAVTKGIGQALNQGAALQQSIGGIETLFKNSAGTVEKNAKSAWSRVGISANQYMEQTTSFAAAMVSSFGGNTAKAAQAADRAMVDMADNANKMGTNMQDIQNAYQGFAKQNYTMLDNLKLGYGGTKTEMARLITDASKMMDVQKKLGVAVKDGDMSFGNITNAITVMQKHLGIAGTTEEEAAKTFSGSMNAMKAAWTDLLGNMALGQNVQASLGNLVTSVKTFVVGNFIPMIGSLFKSAGQLIMDNLPQGLSEKIPALLGKVVPMMTQLSAKIRAEAPKIIKAGLNVMVDLAQGIMNSLPILIRNIPTIISNLAGVINDNAPTVLAAALKIVKIVAVGLLKSIPVLIQNLPKIVKAIFDAWMAFDWLSLGSKAIKSIGHGIKSAAAGVKTWMHKPFNEAAAAIAKVPGKIVGYFRGLPARIARSIGSVWSGIRGAFTSVITNVRSIPGKIVGFFRGLGGRIAAAIGSIIPRISWETLTVKGAKTPLKVPHVTWGAHGGILDGAQLIGAGEAGKEALLPLERNTGWMDTLADKMGGNGQTVNVYMTVNGAEDPEAWASKFARSLRREVRMGAV